MQVLPQNYRTTIVHRFDSHVLYRTQQIHRFTDSHVFSLFSLRPTMIYRDQSSFIDGVESPELEPPKIRIFSFRLPYLSKQLPFFKPFISRNQDRQPRLPEFRQYFRQYLWLGLPSIADFCRLSTCSSLVQRGIPFDSSLGRVHSDLARSRTMESCAY